MGSLLTCKIYDPNLWSYEQERDFNYVVRKGDPVHEILFIIRGEILSITTNGGRTGVFNSYHLKAGDFCGGELLTWGCDFQNERLPISTSTIQAVTDVQAFALLADDIKYVATLISVRESKKVENTYR